MSKKKILIYDDERKLGQQYVERLRKSKCIIKDFEIESMNESNFKKEMKELKERQIRLREKQRWEYGSLELDRTSIFIIDYDLLKVSDSDLFLTGEDVAYPARCFSNCGLIVGLNQYGDNTFDLTLTGHPESYADLNIGSKQLDNPGLWGGEKIDFRPWYWPPLPNFLTSFEKKVKDIKTRLDKPIYDVLGIPKEIAAVLPRSVREFIGGELEMTFKKFVIESGNGLRGRDEHATDDMVARIGATRISKWLERLVLAGQDILVDAPHLVTRYPSLLEGDHSDINTWNKTTNFDDARNLGLDYKTIEDFRFTKKHWLSRPAWFWNKLSSCQKIKEVSEPWEREAINYVFCEDSSDFRPREDCREFIMKSDSPYVRRFVRYFENVSYRPQVRFSL